MTRCTTGTCWWLGQHWRNCRSIDYSSSPPHDHRSNRSNNRPPPDVRLRLLRLAFSGENRCELDTQELDRDGVSYSIDTLDEYTNRYPEAKLHYLIGADHVPTLPQWREAKYLAKLARFVVVPRPGQEVVEFPEPFGGQALQGWPFEVSSTIRQRLALGQAIDGLVPPVVAESLKHSNPYL